MRRKLAAVIAAAAVSMALLACGSKSTASPDTAEAMEEETAPEEAASTEEETTEVSEEPSEEAETESEEVPEQEEDAPIWYMDEEGLKSEELGIKIRRDSAEWEKFGLFGSLNIEIADQDLVHTYVDIPFICIYYEGDLDSFISEYESNLEEYKRKKATIGNVSYASGFTGDISLGNGFTFVGNGISFSISIMSYDCVLEDIWENGLSSYEEDNTDYLAYIRDDTVYCPALNIKLSASDDSLNTVGVTISDKGGYIEIGGNGYAHGNVEKRFEQFTETRESCDETAIDETIERDIGKYQFSGKGFANNYGGELWAFYSNETADSIYIRIANADERKVEDYLSLIEELQ